jgi:hypothetical protein
LSTCGLPCIRSSSDLKISVTLSLVRSNNGRATEARDNGSGAVITASATLLKFLGDIDGQDRGDESGDESELHGEDIGLISSKSKFKGLVERFLVELSEECTGNDEDTGY